MSTTQESILGFGLTDDGGTPGTFYVSGLRETGGPTTLSFGAIADGKLLSRSGTGVVGVTADATLVGLANVTNDAQLKRADGDIASFTAKAAPVGADLLLIEDSAASNAKKSATITNVLAILNGAAPTIAAAAGLTLTGTQTSATTAVIALSNAGSWSASTAVTQVGVSFTQTVAQSSTAGYDALQINMTHSSTGSGTKNLINAKVGGSSVFSVSSTGVMVTGSSVGLGGQLSFNSSSVITSTRSTTTTAVVSIQNGTSWSASTAVTQVGFSVVLTANQSGTAGYDALLVDMTHTATGSGVKSLINAKVGSVSQFSVNSVGLATAIGGLDVSGVSAAASALAFTATSDTPATTWTAGASSNAPSGFMRVTVGGATRYIPYWT